jgi:hypothetical protein
MRRPVPVARIDLSGMPALLRTAGRSGQNRPATQRPDDNARNDDARDDSMADTRQHRGPHPQDVEVFREAVWPDLRAAVAHLSWLLTRGYAPPSSLKLVGDRFHLTERQRRAVLRSSCSDQCRTSRRAGRVEPADLDGERIDIDGFNLLTTVEAALSGGAVLVGRDGCYRDMASMHGSYRKVFETRPALEHIGRRLACWNGGPCRWLLDRPVSNSGRLAALIRETAELHGWNWEVELENDPDARLRESAAVVVSADSAVLDGCRRWLNLAREVIDERLPNTWLVPLGADE